MAKVKKFSFNFQFSKSWLENKIKRVRKLTIPKAARATRQAKKTIRKISRYSSLGLVILVAGIMLISFFLPQNKFQILKERLITNPNDLDAHLKLAEIFLANNQFEKAEKELKLAENLESTQILDSSSNLAILWQKKHYSDPKDIKNLIGQWENIISKYPNYRDGYLQLVYLYYKIGNNQKAKENLSKAKEIDPNFSFTQKMEKFLE